MKAYDLLRYSGMLLPGAERILASVDESCSYIYYRDDFVDSQMVATEVKTVYQTCFLWITPTN